MPIFVQLREKYHYTYVLLRQLVRTDFKLRYQGSILGYLWSLLRPLLLFLILYIVFTSILPVGKEVPHYPVYLLLGIVLWNYFTEVSTGGVASIVNKGDLLRKINFPRYVIVLAGSMAAFINLLINFIVIAVFMIVGHVGLTLSALWMIPLIFELFLVSIAASFFLSALFVRFRDISYIWDVIIQGAFYATPILYPLTKISNTHPEIAKLLLLNPLAQIIQDSRYVLVTRSTITINTLFNNSFAILIPIGITVVSFLVAATYFRKRSKYFAEEV